MWQGEKTSHDAESADSGSWTVVSRRSRLKKPAVLTVTVVVLFIVFVFVLILNVSRVFVGGTATRGCEKKTPLGSHPLCWGKS